MPTARYRCAACGNLTRFDVTVTRRTRAFHHYSLGGDLAVEDEEVLAEKVEEVSCRWCESGRAVETLGPSGPLSGDTGPSGPLSGDTGPSGPLSGDTGPSGPLSGDTGPSGPLSGANDDQLAPAPGSES